MDLDERELYDMDSPYYNDICYSYSSNGKVDKIMDDRMIEYFENNRSLCEEGCKNFVYDDINKYVECRECDIKIDLPFVSDIKIDKNKLYKFVNIKSLANFNVLKCTNLVFSKKGLSTNIGFYIFIPTIIMYFVCIYIFYKKEYKILNHYIKDILYAKKNQKYIKSHYQKKLKHKLKSERPKIESVFISYLKSRKINLSNLQEKTSKKKKNKNNYKTKQSTSKFTLKQKTILEKISEENISEKRENTNTILEKEESNSIKNINNIIISGKHPKKEPPKKEHQKKSLFIPINIDLHSDDDNSSPNNNKYSLKKNKNKNKGIPGLRRNNLKFKKNKILTKEEIKRIEDILKFNDRELNDLIYKDALKYDQRSFSIYYFSLIKIDHILFKIMVSTDYNSRIIKIFLYINNFALCYAVNAFFFTDNTMHKIYLDEGDFNLIYQLPQIVYSIIICSLFQQLFNYFALSEKNILRIKKEKIIKKIIIVSQNVSKVLYCNFIVFFILSFIFMMIFWYYVSCFCAVYKNTQYHLIKDSLISFATSMLTPFGLSLIPVFFRIPALKKKKPYLYRFSLILQIFFG